MFSIRAIALVLSSFPYMSQAAQAADCALAGRWSGAAAASYLAQKRDSQTVGCTAAALYRLARPDYSPNPTMLTEYIDFPRPDASGMIIISLKNVADLYPAVRALVGLGSIALPALLDLLKQSTAEEHVRRNAVRTMKLIHPDDPALPIERLLSAAAAETGTAKHLLEEAARWAYEWCPDSERQECEPAYNAR